MASLRSMIANGDRFLTTLPIESDLNETERSLVRHSKYQLLSHETILVNAHKVAHDLTEALHDGADLATPSMIPCPKPPFHQMWLECNLIGLRSGILVERKDISKGQDPLEVLMGMKRSIDDLQQLSAFRILQQDQPATLIEGFVWQELRGRGAAGFAGQIFYWLDQNGNIQNSMQIPWPPNKDTHDDDRRRLGSFLLWALHTFARLNCHNVKLVPAKDRAPGSKPHHKPHPPFSIWHEIVVENPQYRTQPDAAMPSGEKQEIRFHRVRGHYADYTKGAGLFGRYKIRLWVEEHARGNRELGEVVGSYTVQ